MVNIRISDLDSKEHLLNKPRNGKLGDQEVDAEYAWLIKFLIGSDEQTKVTRCDSKKLYFNKLKNGKPGDQEVDGDYVWLTKPLIRIDEQRKVTRCEDENENGNKNENENENEDKSESENGNGNENEYEYKYGYEYENGDEDEDVDENVDEDEYQDEDVDENDKDLQYCMLLENLTDHGKSYKLKISQDDEGPCFLYYEKQDNSDRCEEPQTCIDNSGIEFSKDLQIHEKAKRRLNEKKGAISTKKEVSRKKKIDDHKLTTQTNQGITMDSCYQMFLNLCISSEHGAVKPEENFVKYEKNVTASDLDSDVVILDNVQNCSKVNNKLPILAEKEPSSREQLMHILKQPYNKKEYKQLSDDIEQKKPIGRHLDLRDRSISSAFGGVEKSLLDNAPGSFRRMLNAAQNNPPKALNLLRMFFFWLEYLPNEDVSEPWKDKHILKVRPRL